ncbi:MAG TPA: hypothetical protein VK968_04390, partial [Roseimicrobium sp.]|nr:hypothetical protein [Roseimicrobium sp.]
MQEMTFATPRRERVFTADRILHVLTTGSALTVLSLVAMLMAVLVYGAWPSIREYGAGFLYTHDWRPNELEQPKIGADGKVVMEDGEVVMETLKPAFGALPVIYGTAVSSLLALVFAIPMSLGAAIFLIRIAPRWLAGPMSFLIEFLAAIPSIAYGLWGLFILAPFLQQHLEPMLRDSLGRLPGFQWLF